MNYKAVHIPMFYYYRGKDRSDLKWIIKRLERVPPSRQKELAEIYEQEYNKRSKVCVTEARKWCNTWLSNEVRK